jgi:calmodulin
MSKKAKGKKSASSDVDNITAKRLEQAFKQTDRDGSGEVSLLLLDKLLANAKENIDEDDIQDALEYMQKDRDEDSFTLEEFIQFINIINSPDRIVEAFQTFDKDGNGYLDKNEFFAIMSSFGGKMSKKEMEDIFKASDLNGDGKVDYREFVEYWNSQ